MEMDHVSPLRTTNWSTGRYRLKRNAFLKPNSKHVAPRSDPRPKPRLVEDFTTLDQLPEIATGTIVNTDTIPHNLFPLYRYRSGSTSSPSLLLSLGGHESSNPQLKHQPSFPASRLTKQPLLPQLKLHDISYTTNHSLPVIDPLSPIDLNVKAGLIETSPASKVTIRSLKDSPVANMDASEGSLNYGKASGGAAYGMNGNVSGPAGNTQNPTSIYQHIHELSAKRVSTLDYLRKAYVAFYCPSSSNSPSIKH